MKIDVYLINALFAYFDTTIFKSFWIDINHFGKHGKSIPFYNLFSCSVLS